MRAYQSIATTNSDAHARANEWPYPRLIDGVDIVSLTLHCGARGSLIALDPAQGLPFDVKRVFYIFNVPAGVSRGNHCVSSHLLLTAPQGEVTITCMTGSETMSLRLDRAGRGLHLKPGVKVVMSDFSADALLLVASSQTYDDVRYFDEPMYPMADNA